MTSREFALRIEALGRFIHREPLRRTHECVFGVLALESESGDPCFLTRIITEVRRMISRMDAAEAFELISNRGPAMVSRQLVACPACTDL